MNANMTLLAACAAAAIIIAIRIIPYLAEPVNANEPAGAVQQYDTSGGQKMRPRWKHDGADR